MFKQGLRDFLNILLSFFYEIFTFNIASVFSFSISISEGRTPEAAGRYLFIFAAKSE